MSREILFRAKKIDSGEWIEGYLFRCWQQAYILWGMINNVPDMKEIEPETICEYTGLTDKNGRKIFEGDIIQFEDTGEDGYEYKEGFDFTNRAKVVWNKGRFELDSFLSNNSGVLEEMNDSHDEFSDIFRYCEVIGNIFDNPDLLEGGGYE